MVKEESVFIIASVVLAAFIVFTQWGLFSNGVFSLGLNVLLAGIVFWFLILSSRINKVRDNWAWYLPLWLILLSIVVYENPWLKLISICLLPFVTGFVFSYRELADCNTLFWNKKLADILIFRALLPLTSMREAKGLISQKARLNENGVGVLLRKSAIGFLILVPVSALVLVLLTSADANFASLVETISNVFFRNINFEFFMKLICIGLLTTLVLAMLLVWRGEFNVEYVDKSSTSLDDVVVGIVVIGLLLIYSAFVISQLEYLLINDLPTELSDAEKIVKSGFWQLFFLSFLNAVMFFVVYKKTSRVVQILLQAFIFASSLIVLSGCWRMALYVYWYGLSYEKFFASYTAIYALVLFAFLVLCSFVKAKKDIFRVIVFSSLWFYAAATVMPVEKIIFRTNIFLSLQPDSRIDLYHLSDLSLDVMGEVRKELKKGRIDPKQWNDWLALQRAVSCTRPWYETNLSRRFGCG